MTILLPIPSQEMYVNLNVKAMYFQNPSKKATYPPSNYNKNSETLVRGKFISIKTFIQIGELLVLAIFCADFLTQSIWLESLFPH